VAGRRQNYGIIIIMKVWIINVENMVYVRKNEDGEEQNVVKMRRLSRMSKTKPKKM
jgi:hypothetical protein